MKPSVVALAPYLVASWMVAAQPSSRSLAAEPPLESGLQPGEHISAVFEPVNINGPFAGEPHCLVCENGLCPVAMVFARDIDEPLTKLLGKLDAAVVKHAKQEMGGFAVFVSDDEKLESRLQKAAEQAALKKVVLAVEAPPGPTKEYKVSPQAAVTVIFYNEHEVRANHAFRPGELDDAAIERILADVPKLLSEK